MQSDSKPITILYVDDDELLHEPFKIFMESEGDFKVITSTSADDALNRMRDKKFSVIVSDYQMPGEDGIEFLRNLRSTNNMTPFILFTGRGREEVVIDAINSGADFYIQKGGDPTSQFAELGHYIKTAVTSRAAEMEAVTTREQLSSFFGSTSDLMALFDREGRVVKVNHAFEQMFGMAESDIVGKKLSEITNGELSCIETTLERVVSGGISIYHDEKLKDAAGGTRYLGAISNPIRDQTGQISFVACSARDITDRVRLQAITKMLHDASVSVLRERPLKNVMSNLCIRLIGIFEFKAIMILSKNDNGRIGLLAEEGVAAYNHIKNTIRWDNTPEGQSPSGRAIRTGEIQVARTGDANFRPWAEITLELGYNSVISIPLRYDNEIIGAMSIGGNNIDDMHGDILAQLQNTANTLCIAIQSSRQRDKMRLLEMALQNVTDTIVLTDKDGRIQWVNSAFMKTTGFGVEETVGNTPRLLKSGKHEADFYKRLWDTILGGKIFHDVLTNRRKNGELYFEDTVITPVKDENGVISHFVAIKREITRE